MSEELETISERILRQRIGGRWALSWQSFLITAILGIFSLAVGEQYAATSTYALMSWLGLGVAGTAALGVLYVILDRTVFRNRRERPLPVWVVVSADGIFGVLFSLVVGLGAVGLDLQTNISLFQRIILNAIFAMWWGPSLSYFLDYRDEAKNTQKALIKHAVNLKLAELQRSEIVVRLRQEILHEVGDELSPVRDSVAEYLESTSNNKEDGDSSPTISQDDWRSLSQLLMGTAQNSVRPLSERFLRVTISHYPKTPWWSVLVNIVRYQPFRPLAYAMVDIFGTLTVYVHIFGMSRGLFILFSGLFITVTIAMSANVVMRHYPQIHAQIFLVTVAVLQVTVIYRASLREMWVPGSAPASWQVTQIFAGIVVIFVTSGFGAWRDKDVELQLNFRAKIHKDQVEAIARSQQVVSLALETSQILHGAVQTRLIACAMLIEQASKQNDQDMLNTALRETLEILDSPIPLNSSTESVSEEIIRKASLWEGLCEFEIDIEPKANIQSAAFAQVVGRVVEEGVSNAIRHGRATRINISVSRINDDRYLVLVADNGRGFESVAPGMGSAYLTQVSGSNWSLNSGASGSELRVSLRS